MKTTDLIPLILHQLIDEDKYGYDIVKQIEEDSNGIINIKQPTLYSLLKKLEQNKFITSYWKDSEIGGKRHYYQITANGKSQIETYPAYSKLIQNCCEEEIGSPTLSNTSKQDLNAENYTLSGNNNQNFSAIQNSAESTSPAGVNMDNITQAENNLETEITNNFSNISKNDNHSNNNYFDENCNMENINNYQNINAEYGNISQNTDNVENSNNSSQTEDVLEGGYKKFYNITDNDNQIAEDLPSKIDINSNLSNNVLNQDFKADTSPIETQSFVNEEIKITPINLVKDEPVTDFKFGDITNNTTKSEEKNNNILFNQPMFNSISANEDVLNNTDKNSEQIIDISQNTAYKDTFSKDVTPEPQKSVNIFDIIEPVECNTKPTLNKNEIDSSTKISTMFSGSSFASSSQSSSPISENVNDVKADCEAGEKDENSLNFTFANQVEGNEVNTSYTSNNIYDNANVKTSISNEKNSNKNLDKLTKNGLNPKLEEQVTNFTLEQPTSLNQVDVIDHDSVPYANYVNLKTDISATKRRKSVKLHTLKMMSTSFILMIMLAISIVLAVRTSFTKLYCVCLITVGLITIFYPLLYAKNKTKMRLKFCTRPFVYNITMDFFIKLSMFLILFTLIFAYNIKICNDFKDIFTFSNASNFISPLMFSFALLIDFCLSALFFKRFIVKNKK